MAEFLKTKTSTFVNRPVGIVSTNTGATEVGNAIAKLGSEIQDRAFRDAVVEQEKLGQNTVMNLSVLDEDNKLVMRQLPTNLSQVARNTAEPLLRKKMSNAIQVDTQTGLAEIRKTAKNEQEFKEKALVYLDQVTQRMKETGGANYVEDFKNMFSKVYAQHGNDLKIKDGIKENEYHLTNQVKTIESRIANIVTEFETGDPEAENNIASLMVDIRNLPDEYMNVKQSGVNNLLETTMVAMQFGILKKGIAGATSNDLVKIQSAILSNGVNLAQVPEKYKKATKLAIESTETSLLPKLNDELKVLKGTADQLEQDARLEKSRNAPVNRYKSTKKQQEFNNNIVTELQNAKTFDQYSKIMEKVKAREKENLKDIGLIGEQTILNNEKSMYQAITDGIKNNILSTIPDIKAKDINAIRQAIISNGTRMSGLRQELVEPVKEILKGTPDSLNNKLAQGFSQLHALVKDSEVEQKKQQDETNLNNDIQDGIAITSKQTNTQAEKIILNGKDESYFYTQQSLNDPEIQKFIATKGYLPPTIVNQMQQLADGNLEGEARAVAINRFARFSRYLNPKTNNIQNKLTVKGGISSETNSLLMAALDVAEIKGIDNFNDILDNIKMRKEDKPKFDNLVRMVLHDGKSGDVEKYLRNQEQKLEYNVINEMKPYVEYLISSGINDKGKIDELVTNFIDSKFLPTNGLIVDQFGPVNKSMYAIEAILPNDTLATQFIDKIEDDLPDRYTLNTGIISSSDNFFDKLTARRGTTFGLGNKIPSLFFESPATYAAAKVLGTATEIAKGGEQKKVMLAPHPISPTNIDQGYGGEVIYYAMTLSPTNEVIPLIGTNKDGEPTMYAWSTSQVTKEIIKKERDAQLQLMEDRLKDDIGSEELAQEAINKKIVEEKLTAEKFGKVIPPIGAF